MKSITFLALLLALPLIGQAQFDSLRMRCVGRWNSENPTDNPGISRYSDVWGYAADGREYGIIGSRDSIHFIDVTEPYQLRRVNSFAGTGSTTWRDFKTYDHYAFAGSERSGEGLFVFDLQYLPDSVVQVTRTTQFWPRSHNIFVDTATARLYGIGSLGGTGTDLKILDISDPTSITELASLNLPYDYIHDAYVRNDTVYASHGDFNTTLNEFVIYDCTSGTDCDQIGLKTSYAQEGYNHSSWVTDDGSHVIWADESRNRSLKMASLTVDPTEDPDERIQIGTPHLFRSKLLEATTGDTTSIAHNPYIKGDSVYISYYHDGIVVFDISDPTDVTLAAYYDTYPENTSYNGFQGAWGCYPYLPSGRILGSDRSRGLFLLETKSCDSYPSNVWIGPADGEWNDSPSNWSQARFPEACDHVIIPAGKNVALLSGKQGYGSLLTVENGGQLLMQSSSQLTVRYRY